MADPAWDESLPEPVLPGRSSAWRFSLRELFLVGLVVALTCALLVLLVKRQRDAGWMERQWREEQAVRVAYNDLWEHAFREFGAKPGTAYGEFRYHGVHIAIEEEFHTYYDSFRSCRFDAPLFDDPAALAESMRYCASAMFGGKLGEQACERALAELEEIRDSTSGARYASVREFDVEWIHVRIEAETADVAKRRVTVSMSTGEKRDE